MGCNEVRAFRCEVVCILHTLCWQIALSYYGIFGYVLAPVRKSVHQPPCPNGLSCLVDLTAGVGAIGVNFPTGLSR